MGAGNFLYTVMLFGKQIEHEVRGKSKELRGTKNEQKSR